MDILKKVQDVFRDVFDDPALEISADTTNEDIEEWDSLAQISIVSGIESAFGIRFDVADIVAFDSVGVLIHMIEKKQGK